MPITISYNFSTHRSSAQTKVLDRRGVGVLNRIHSEYLCYLISHFELTRRLKYCIYSQKYIHVVVVEYSTSILKVIGPSDILELTFLF